MHCKDIRPSYLEFDIDFGRVLHHLFDALCQFAMFCLFLLIDDLCTHINIYGR